MEMWNILPLLQFYLPVNRAARANIIAGLGRASVDASLASVTFVASAYALNFNLWWLASAEQ